MLWGFKIGISWFIPWKAKTLKSSFQKNHSGYTYFFLLGNKVDFLSSDHMRLWTSSPQLWRVDKTEAGSGESAQHSWQEAHAQYASIYGVTTKLELYPLLFTRVWCPYASLCPCLPTKLGNTELQDSQRPHHLFHTHSFCAWERCLPIISEVSWNNS